MRIIPPFQVEVIESKIYIDHTDKRAKDIQDIIEYFTHRKTTLFMSNTKSRKYAKQISSMKRHIENLKKECRQPKINGKKVDDIKLEIERIAVKLP